MNTVQSIHNSGVLLGFKKERSRHAYYNVDEPKQHGDERKET